jgi:undecaprenyl-diphosphatase
MLISDVAMPVQVVVLAVIQGIAEFLPVSSSGHVVVTSTLFGIKDSSELNVVLHVGTLMSILVYYRQRIFELLTTDRKVILWLVIGTIPAAIIGVSIKLMYKDLLNSPLLAGCMFPITGAFLLIMKYLPNRNKNYKGLELKDVLVVGIFQAFALLPGISRSGSTILAGVLMGQKRQSATTFSFLLAIPAILGAASIEGIQIYKEGSQTPIVLLLVGMAIAFVIGMFALHWLVKWVEIGKLHLFAYYLFPLGIVVVFWQLMAGSN